MVLVVALATAACRSTGVREPAPRMSAEEAMARTLQLGQPGPEHRALAELAGRWRQECRYRFSAGAGWHEASGVTEAEMLCDGRFLLERSVFQLDGAQVEAYQIHGYDNLSDEATWLGFDSLSTWWIEARGKRRRGGGIEFTGTLRDAGGERPFRMVVERRPDGSLRRVLYDAASPGEEVEVMTIVSRR